MERAYRAADVAAAEQPLVEAGEPLMARASYEVAQQVINSIHDAGLTLRGSTVLVLAGPGNNGGDALFAGAFLARKGLGVRAAYNGTAHEKALEAARKAGVRLYDLAADGDWEATLRDLAFVGGIWIDGLLGIGSRGGLREPFSDWVRVLNEERAMSPQEPTVVAVDVPSGVGVDDGTVPGEVLKADITVVMGVAKPCHLLPPACHYAGDVRVLDLGFFANLGAPAAVELSDADVRDMWDAPGIDSHKYTRGVLGMLTGSETYPGAAVLGVGGALAVGPGMIRHVGYSDLVLARYPEVVPSEGKVQAWVIGSGLDSLDRAASVLAEAVADGVPVVLDAGAIELVHSTDVNSTVVITPHAGELTELLKARGEEIERTDVEANPARAARLSATLTGATVALKGNVDVIAAPDGPLYAQRGATPWRSTAGAGDVYAGILGGLLAGYGDELRELGHGRGIPARLAAAASLIHLRGSNLAAHASTGIGAPISASKIVDALGETILRILNSEELS